MNAPAFLAHTDGYIQSQIRDSQNPWNIRPSPGQFITLSREAGSGGSSLARLLARKLNADAPAGVLWRVFERNLTAQMLRENRLPARTARFLPEDGVREIPATIGELVGLHPNIWELVQKTNETMCRLAAAGNVILVGRGANFATRDVDGGLHVRLVASDQHRARYLAQLYNITEKEARAHNVRCDAARRRYVRTNFGADITDPTAYDLCLNTDRLTLNDAANLILEHLSATAP